MFRGCPNLKSIVVEEGNKKYDSRENCNAIVETATNTLVCGTENSTIPSTITAIGSSAFAETGLKNCVIPEGVTSIQNVAFENCQNLESVTLPQSLKRLGSRVFANSGLTSVVIPEGITWLSDGTFWNCNSLAEVVCKAKVAPQLKSDAFSNDVLSKATLYVPEESVESYKADGEWKKFSDIQPLPYAYINISAAEKTTYCSEHALDFTNIEGAKAYIASGFSPSTGVVLLTKVDKVPARVGFMVIGKEGKYEVPYCETDFTYANLLVGTMSQTTVASTADGKTNYVLSKGSDGVMFYLANNAMVPAKKAYLSIPSTIVDETHVKAVRLAFEDDMTTNIIRVEDMTKKTTDKVYGLDGRCKMGLSSGINIVNGKKIYVK